MAMTIDLNGKFTKRDLLALPEIEWGEEPGWWDALLIVPTPRRHESGFAHIAIIGVTGRATKAERILARPDDIHFPAESGLPGLPGYSSLRMDAYHPSGVLRLWSSTHEFSIGMPVSSVDIHIRPRREA